MLDKEGMPSGKKNTRQKRNVLCREKNARQRRKVPYEKKKKTLVKAEKNAHHKLKTHECSAEKKSAPR